MLNKGFCAASTITINGIFSIFVFFVYFCAAHVACYLITSKIFGNCW